MIYSDIHVHSTYCDGKNSPEEMVKKALEFIGFDTHTLRLPLTEMESENAQRLKDAMNRIDIR